MYFLSESSAGWNFTLENYDSVWSVVIQLCILLFALLLGNVLRNTIKFLRKSLIPASLIGGLLLLLVNILFVRVFKWEPLVNKNLMQIVTYHALAIGFIAMALKTVKKDKTNIAKTVENGAMTGATYMMQAFVGILVGLAFYFIRSGGFYDIGVLLPLGFGQGPGNALTWDINFTDAGLFAGNGSFGLSIASIGFIVASVIGVIYIAIFKKKGQIVVKEVPLEEKKVEYFEGENEIGDSESVDKFSIQIALVLLGYLLSFGIMFIFAKLSNFTNSIAWGFNFIWGVITANLIKLLLKGLKKAKIVKRNYINNFQMDRISGFAFDVMIVAGVAAIEINDVKQYIWELIALCIVGTIITILYIRFVTKRKFKGYEHEMFVTNYGTLTGTASNGMILLKEIDPAFTSPASSLFITSQLPAMIFVAPLLLILNFSSKSLTHTLISAGIFFVLFVAYNLYIFRSEIFKRKK